MVGTRRQDSSLASAVGLLHPPPDRRGARTRDTAASRLPPDSPRELVPKQAPCNPSDPPLPWTLGHGNQPPAAVPEPQGPMGPAGVTARPGRFFGVYLLYCLNPRYRGRVYVGFTVNPARRVQQHNGGRKKGGAWRTSGRGPWEMVLVVHGFPSAVAALRFEWAWQHPHASRRLAHVGPRLRGETAFAFHLRVLAHMLRAPPWARLPLTLRWLRPDLRQDLCLPPPPHVPLAFGPPPPQAPAPRRRAGPFDDAEPEPDQGDPGACCSLCAQTIQDEEGPLCCPNPGCWLRAHVICLAEEFLREEPGQLLPLEGQCPSCEKSLLWGDLIWLCQMDTEKEVEDSELEEAHWTDLLET
ncbi:structure-specific endonuclease subunit SLX1 isoform X1 [Piliocolobus tephrosceles]|uniref:SLX1 homolog A, structure-specific endonuclease subunit n=1 Tax=Piliocolobus tephrosceles TaxID=591936 RepID=A0A8C9LRW9_9PRIM|nr:structure-specific endonuclease subunit SLX1 isoform X1 [Piliocolobus tephrosceles]